MQIATTTVDLDAMNTQLNKQVRYPVYGVFSTTDATCTVKVPAGCRRFRIAGYMWMLIPATDEHLYIAVGDHPVGADGVFTATASGSGFTITLSRVAASKTSGLSFCVEIVGLP